MKLEFPRKIFETCSTNQIS